jgi:hypothetical protein
VCRWVRVEDDQCRSIRFEEWVERDDGAWVLRVRRQSRSYVGMVTDASA